MILLHRKFEWLEIRFARFRGLFWLLHHCTLEPLRAASVVQLESVPILLAWGLALLSFDSLLQSAHLAANWPEQEE